MCVTIFDRVVLLDFYHLQSFYSINDADDGNIITKKEMTE